MLNFPAYKIKKGDYTILFKKLINNKNHFNDIYISQGRWRKTEKVKAGERIGKRDYQDIF